MSAITIKPEIEKREGPNFTAVQLGAIDTVDQYETNIATMNRVIRGKLFLKGLLGMTGMEVSVTKLPAGASVPFLHRHKTHEELYLFTGGRGEMQVDGETFAVQEGSAVRVATGGARSIRAAANEPIEFICVQARQGAMPDHEAGTDGERVPGDVRWPG